MSLRKSILHDKEHRSLYHRKYYKPYRCDCSWCVSNRQHANRVRMMNAEDTRTQ